MLSLARLLLARDSQTEREEKVKSRKLTCVVALILFAAVPTALASTTWYVNGVSGSNSNNCLSASTPCKTIGHAISIAASNGTGLVLREIAGLITENQGPLMGTRSLC